MNLDKVIKDSIYNILMDYFVEEVFTRYRLKKNSILVIFSECEFGIEASIRNTEFLIKEGFSIKVLCTRKLMEEINKSEFIRSVEVICLEEVDNIEKYVEESKNILFETVSESFVGSVVNSIFNTPESKIFKRAVMNGKNIFVFVAGCCPDDEERNSKYPNILDGYKEMLRENMVRLNKFDIKLLTYKSHSKINNILCNKVDNNSMVKINKQVVTYSDITMLKNNSNLKLLPNSIITDYAKDEAVKKKINIIQ